MLNIQRLIDDSKCFEVVRQLRWLAGGRCPACGAEDVTKRRVHTRPGARQRSECQACGPPCDDRTDTIFDGHHPPLTVWVVWLYLRGLHLSNQQMAAALALHERDVQVLTIQRRAGVMANKSRSAGTVWWHVPQSPAWRGIQDPLKACGHEADKGVVAG
jgi:transposase-like protein